MCEKQDKDEQRYAEKYADYVKMLKNTLSKKRFTHSMNVASMCLALAKKHGGDEEKAYLAGLLHDIKKEETPNAMKSQAILSNMDVSDEELYTPALWQRQTSSASTCCCRKSAACGNITCFSAL